MKHRDLILESIDHLRGRKARPDLERICHFLQRRHDVSFAETRNALEKMISAGIIVKVDYKGHASYRNVAKWNKKRGGSDDSEGPSLTPSANPTPPPVDEPEKGPKRATEKKQPSLSATLNKAWGMNRAKKIKKKAVAAKSRAANPPAPPANKQGGKHYLLSSSLAKSLKRKGLNDTTDKNGDDNKASMSSSAATPKVIASGKKARTLPNKRKRIQKNLGPDFVTNYESTEDEDMSVDITRLCMHCGRPPRANLNGAWLNCSDCGVGAHGSCLKYSPELAMKTRRAAWQCHGCRSCSVCSSDRNSSALLFCDSCDEAFHASCHSPRVITKPADGRWTCRACTTDQQPPKKQKKMNPLAPAKANSPPPSPLEPKQEPEAEEPEEEENSDEDSDVSVELRDYVGDSNKARVKAEPIEVVATTVKQEPAAEVPSGLPTPCVSPEPPSDVANIFHDQHNSLLFASSRLIEKGDDEDIPDAAEWSVDDVCQYLIREGFGEQADTFKQEEIDGTSLLLMRRADVLSGLSLKLGPALKIYNHVKRLQTRRMDGHLL